jgi:hypothetical protein
MASDVASSTVRSQSPRVHFEQERDDSDSEHEGQTKDLTPIAAPPLSFAAKYMDVMQNELELLPAKAGDSAGKRTLKIIARVIITIIVFPLFALLGMLYNIALALAKGGTGAVKRLLPGIESLKEYSAKDCFKEAFKHLCFAIIDGLSWVFSCLVTGAYAFAPAEVERLYADAQVEIDSNQMYDTVSGLLDKFSKNDKPVSKAVGDVIKTAATDGTGVGVTGGARVD